MNVEIGAKAAQFLEKEYINGIAVAVRFNCYLAFAVRKLRNFLLIFNRSIWKETDAKSMRKGTLFQNMVTGLVIYSTVCTKSRSLKHIYGHGYEPDRSCSL